MTDERLERIETKIAYLEDTVQELNLTVYQQQKRLDQLQTAMEALVTHVREIERSVGEGSPAHERPPHY